ncbi:MAG: hypothetical protein ACREHC_06445 [Candidatus Levyibacteriota bacterium]
MDKTIIKQLEELQKAIAKINASMLTKDDAKNFATKDDLKNFATKDDLKNFATKDDLKNFATKDDLQHLKKELIKEIRDSEAFIVNLVDKNMAEKSDIKQLERRVAIIERKIAH